MTLDMQEELMQATLLINELFVDGFGRDLRLQIGGGSTLAARYDHRLSTDLDIWRKDPETEADRGYDATPPMQLEDLMAHEAWQGGRPQVNMHGNLRGFLRPEVVGSKLPEEVDGIEVSAGKELAFPRSEHQRQHRNVTGTILRPQNDEEILWGKLIRMKDRALTRRDLYDFAVMSHCAPDRVGYALDQVGPVKRRQIAQSIRRKVIDKTKPLLEPKWIIDDLEAVKNALLGTLESQMRLGQEARPLQRTGRWDLRRLQATCKLAIAGPHQAVQWDGGMGF